MRYSVGKSNLWYSILDIGNRITGHRKRNSWSQSDLAESIGTCRDIMGKYKRNENSPTREMALKIANVFDLPVDNLLVEGKQAPYHKKAIK